jgi:hypothetical protein
MHDGVEVGRDLAGLVAADALEVGADLVAELGLGPAGFLAELAEPLAEGHGRGTTWRGTTSRPASRMI